MRHMRRVSWALALVGCEVDEGGWEQALPDIVARSRYVDLRVDVESSTVCMEDKLAEIDRFIEETAAFLGVPVPAQRIGFVIAPVEGRTRENWPCTEIASSCYVQGTSGGFVFDEPSDVGMGKLTRADYHEFVHAVDIPANGRTHWVLEEGLATYLGNDGSAEGILGPFPAALVESLRMTSPTNYGVAMQFVGSLIEAHGMARFDEFRRGLAPSAAAEEVIAAFELVYGEDFDEALAALSTTAIRGRRADVTCEGEAVLWSGEPPLRANLTAACGDGWFYGGLGFGLINPSPDDSPGVYAKPYLVEVPETAIYNLAIIAPDLRAFGRLRACGDTPGDGSVVSYEGHGSSAVLEAGTYELFVAFPEGAATDVSVTLTYQGPPPSP
ncbi:hypothetical protein OV203_22195 [Nannocystis sp. ILAH1]|uniref:hypothetical protein n=1 Tax=Nannocystis sp. ILAH1 TaxID=2996789 RepID=UPI00226DD986|nr:hypothetical protein [Nannocystis sp. ILAH1]MCY0989866.1 hypothetical protein [Nannocystis sp. ILAH1]